MWARNFLHARSAGPDGLRFLLAGGANTLLTLALYQLLLFVLSPDIAYTLCWLVGMGFLLVVYPSKVFVGSANNPQRMTATVLIYGAVFLLSIACLRALVGQEIHPRLAIFSVLVVSTLTNFVLMRLIYRRLFSDDTCVTWHPLWLAPVTCLAVVLFIWAPFGFSLTGLIEEWGVLGIFSNSGPLYFITAHTPFASNQMRPLTSLPHAIAYRLDPDSFTYWHVLQALFIWMKGVSMAYIVWWLRPQRRLALFAGALMMLYPADTMQLSFRALHINGSVGLMLGAVACILAATRQRSRAARMGFALAAGLQFIAASLMYEASLFLAPLPLLLWWGAYGWRDGLARLRQHRPVIGIWALAIACCLGFLVWISQRPDLYQQSISGNPLLTLKTMAHHSPLLINTGLYRILINGWYDAARMLASAAPFLPFLGVFLLFAVGICWKMRASDAAGNVMSRPATRHDFLRWALVGGGASVLGYLPYLSSLSHLLITQRTYLFASIGGALVCVALVVALVQCMPLIGRTLAILMLVLGMVMQWTQFAQYNALAARQKVILSGIVETVPHLVEGERLLILDRSGALESTWMLRGELLGGALTYFYGKKTEPIICLEPGLLWSSFAADPKGRLGRCVEHARDWEIGVDLPTPATHLPKSHLLTVVIEPDGVVHRLPAAPPAPIAAQEATRWRKILGCWPAQACRAQAQLRVIPDRFFFDFGRWWSLEEAPPGAGWRDAQWNPPALQPISFAWKDQPVSNLWFTIAPREVPYRLRMKLIVWTLPAAKDALKMTLNGKPLHHTWSADNEAVADIPRDLFRSGLNELRFASPVDMDQGVSLGIDWVRVEPADGK